MTRDARRGACARSPTASTLAVDRARRAGPVAADDDRRRARVPRACPAGYELTTLVHAIVEAGRVEPSLSAASLERLAALERDVAIDVYVTPDLTALPAGRAAGVPARARLAARHRARDRGVGVRRRRRPPRRPRRPRDRRRRPLRLGGRGAGGRVRRARARRRRRPDRPYTQRSGGDRPRERAARRSTPRLALAELPADAGVFDAHTHLGDDIDGMVGDRDELLAIQRAYGIDRLVRVLPRRARPRARRSPRRTTGRSRTRRRRPTELVPFVRLDLDESPIEEATRCLDLGARGIKLHPRAQRFLARRPAPRARVRARGGAARPDPDPRRPRPAADRRLARAPARPPRAARADHRPRGHRRPRRDGRELRRAAGRLLRHLRVEPARPARPLPARAAASRSSSPPTTPTAASRTRC